MMFRGFARSGLLPLLALASVVAVVSGCVRSVEGEAMAARLSQGTLNWGECGEFVPENQTVPASTQCSELEVPVDYANPDGAKARLAIIKYPAKGNKIGSLLMNPGGPGQSGIEAAIEIVKHAPKEIRERFDFIGFDPRGVGSSTPAIECNTDADVDRMRAQNDTDYSPEGVARMEQDSKDFVKRCLDKVGKEFLANVGTVNVAKDMDRMREALGDDKLTYLGYSYGTRIGTTYAEQFPQNVRALILDGVIDPNADPTQADIDQIAGFQKAFDNYAADCTKNPTCPLGTDPAQTTARYRAMVDPLVEHPVKTRDGRGLSHADAIIGTIMVMYSPTLWDTFTKALRELSEGRGDILQLLSDAYMKRDDEGHYSHAQDAQTAINCVDEPPQTDRAKAIEKDRRIREVAPFQDYGTFTGNAPLGVCAFWPVPATSKPHPINVPGLPKLLVVSTTYDPATPYQAGVELAKQLGGGLLTYDGTKHTIVFDGNQCVDQAAQDYLIKVTTPAEGTRC
ncbi:alpha/beta hydrolase [Mycobacteroides sp. LB1]|uniref:alpha/beta hydrolase n=1 Tax=Mycobacteroides sp. LB1 TaxID=2750814 RepID=UPI0015DD5B53|nr:alpha/beta hydrolase [Mycobacteroides sp. LB1]